MENENIIMELIREMRQDVKDTRSDVAEVKVEQARQNSTLTHHSEKLNEIEIQLNNLKNKENPFFTFCRENGKVIWIGFYAIILTLLGVNITPIITLLSSLL